MFSVLPFFDLRPMDQPLSVSCKLSEHVRVPIRSSSLAHAIHAAPRFLRMYSLFHSRCFSRFAFDFSRHAKTRADSQERQRDALPSVCLGSFGKSSRGRFRPHVLHCLRAITPPRQVSARWAALFTQP